MTAELSLAIVGCAVVVAFVAWLRTHELAGALALMLDLWVAAGLLHLTHAATWRAILAAAAIIAIRKLVVHGLDANRARLTARSSGT
ncbi:MAG TPA: hypothetical protein VLT45_21425 [Kofleriaceae bacterium]|nr:hypothetical protein [Kofleriaceae bacterium]